MKILRFFRKRPAVQQPARTWLDYLEQRKTYYRFFSGIGLDIGPFDKPFIPDGEKHGIEVQYVDRYEPAELARLFGEVTDLKLVKPHYICNVSQDGLPFAKNETYDFIIMSHVLEHLANPFFLIAEAYRVLREGGVLFISVPDERFSVDHGRPLSTYEELKSLYERDVRNISDEQVQSWLQAPVIREIDWVKKALANPDQNYSEIYDNERNRSFHVHVWQSRGFLLQICRFICEESLGFSLLDLAEHENNGYEGVIVLRKDRKYSPARLFEEISMLYRLRTGKQFAA